MYTSLVDFHTLQDVELFLANLLLGSHCHAFVGWKEALCQCLGTVAFWRAEIVGASTVSRVSVKTASAATIIVSNSSIGVAEARLAARRSSSNRARFSAFSTFASARRIVSMLERLTPEPEEGFLWSGRLHQCPEVSSSSPLATSYQVPLQGELVLCILTKVPEPVFELLGLVRAACRERFDAPLWQAKKAAGTESEPRRSGKAERAASVPRPW